jgi:hypothetical protein
MTQPAPVTSLLGAPDAGVMTTGLAPVSGPR